MKDMLVTDIIADLGEVPAELDPARTLPPLTPAADDHATA